ncbi:Oidioi.mRNA.OKI2018_I69.chr1.g245.t1.cds [Oikopleura dioica]|uniref:Metalloendopeptidase n=1 Tax=Oikopleura dioica TaxID=34765 RepID=A0ABN7SJA0_OIKDI|nr:Oidioi.mRNA.OKI2018_I69.chr1.g245.t1.cds [Oikopleura dioica]
MRPDCPKMNNGTGVIHLFMHILGFTHESSRYHRDLHMGVTEKFAKTTEFYKFPLDEKEIYVDYDFHSVLHHPADGLPNIHHPSRPSQLAPVDLHKPFSAADLVKINFKYPCPSKNDCLQNPPPCGHGLNKCEETIDGFNCICADGFELRDSACVDVNECVDPDLNTCSNPGDCINTEGGFRCEQKKIDIVWLIDGTGSYTGYQNDAKKAFKDQVLFLNNLQRNDPNTPILSFAWMTSSTNKVYQAGLALKEVDKYSFGSSFDSAFSKINDMYGGGDAPEDPLLGIIFTMTDPAVNWDPDSIKQVHIFTDIDYHHDSLSSRHPPLQKWTSQPSSLYTFYDRDLANDFTFGFVRDLGKSYVDFIHRPEIAIDQLYFNVAGSTSAIRAYDYFTKGISGTLEDWMPVYPTRSNEEMKFNPNAYKRNISEHNNQSF